jgi:N-methylhydantoinase A/acetophenone carboxylase
MLDVIRLKAECATAHYAFHTFEDEGESPDAALKGTRSALFDISAGFSNVPVYEQSRLRSGNLVRGPAIVDSEDTTVLVPASHKYRIDTQLKGIIEEA